MQLYMLYARTLPILLSFSARVGVNVIWLKSFFHVYINEFRIPHSLTKYIYI